MESSQENTKSWMAPFFTIWGGQAVSLLGSQLVQFALIWWLTQKTGSATVLATATLVGLLPQVLLGPLVGALVDRWNRRMVMLCADAVIAIATLGLALLFFTGTMQIWHIYLLMLIRSLGGGFHWPAMQASTSLMVPKDNLARVQGLNQMLQGAMNIGAAPLGALLLTFLPIEGILIIDVVTAMFAITPLLFIHVPQPQRSISPDDEEEKPSVWADLVAGLRYVWRWPGLLLIMVMATLINFLLTPASSLAPLLVTKHFGGGAFEFAWMESLWGLGVVAGGILLSVWGGFKRQVSTSLLFLIVLGAGMSLLGVLPASAFGIALVIYFLVGITNPLINGPLFAIVQSIVAPDMQGRIFMLILSAAGAMSPLSLIIAGPLADRFSVQLWYIIGGVITAMLGIGAFFIPAIYNIEKTNGNGTKEQDNQGTITHPLEITPADSGAQIQTDSAEVIGD